ncbi:MAG: hypothetical protein JNL98_31455 [Bryobacterales bacterium]|nr:hypothetical protein [Bryobacterales bacterium]
MWFVQDSGAGGREILWAGVRAVDRRCGLGRLLVRLLVFWLLGDVLRCGSHGTGEECGQKVFFGEACRICVVRGCVLEYGEGGAEADGLGCIRVFKGFAQGLNGRGGEIVDVFADAGHTFEGGVTEGGGEG